MSKKIVIYYGLEEFLMFHHSLKIVVMVSALAGGMLVEARNIPTITWQSDELVGFCHRYSKGGSIDLAKWLLSQGADANVRNATCLELAVRSGGVDLVRLLIAHGAKVNNTPRRNDDYTNPHVLHVAAAKGYKEICEILINAGADVNYQSYNRGMWGGEVGPSALYFAAKYGHTAVCQVLIRAGAKVNSRMYDEYDYPGYTPLDGAKRNGHTDLVQLLREAGGIEAQKLP